MSKKPQNEGSNIRVVCRCRPLNKLELEQGGEQCVKILDDCNISVAIQGEEQPHQFSFDKIFPSETRQVDVFREVGQPVLESVMQGINSTIFAYGQTSSGKTHTMEGKHDDLEYMGLIPRMMERIFEMIAEAPSTIEFSLKASFLEIYNEKIHDLLDQNKTNLNVKEDKIKGIFVQDATEAFVVKASDMMKVMRKGAENRSVAATRMNERSSRSHSIFLITLLQKNTSTGTTRMSKLYFVDLAGSEKIAKTHVTGQQLEEAKNINKSLTCLGIVINALSEKKDHIPYRDSKLTRILQESIGGNSKTTLIIACSMCSYNDKETLGTLRFGQRAKSVKNSAKVNEERSAKELMSLLTKAEQMIKFKDELISALQAQLGQDFNQMDYLKKSNSIADFSLGQKSLLSSQEVEQQSPSSKKDLSKPPVKLNTSKVDKTQQSQSQANAQSQRKMLEQHLEIIKLKERIAKLEEERQDQDIELENKTQDLKDEIEKCKGYSDSLEQIKLENSLSLKKSKEEIQKLRKESQVWLKWAGDIKKFIARLSSDLNFLLVQTELEMSVREGKDCSESEKLAHTIKQALQQIEQINSTLSKLDGDDDTQENKSILSPKLKNGSCLFLRQQQHQNNADINEALSTDAEDLAISDDSFSSNEDTSQVLIIEKDECEDEETAAEEEDIKQILDMTSFLNEDYQKQELQAYIIQLKREFRKIQIQNKEYSVILESRQQYSENILLKYKKKLVEIKKSFTQKIKDSETKMQSLNDRVNEKAAEARNVISKFENEIAQKNNAYSNLKVEFEGLRKAVQSNQPISKIAELQSKIKELGTDKQRLFNDLFQIRNELASKEQLLQEKEVEIAMMLKMKKRQSKEFLNMRVNSQLQVTPRAAIVERKFSQEDVEKNKFVSMKSHIAPSIRGGGGNIESFKKNNPFIFSSDDNIEEKLDSSNLSFTNQINILKISNSNEDQKKSQNQIDSSIIDEDDDESLATEYNQPAFVAQVQKNIEQKFSQLGTQSLQAEKPQQQNSFFSTLKKMWM